MTTTTERYRNELEYAYLLGYRHATTTAGRKPINLRAFPGLKRSRVLTACYEQGYEAGLEHVVSGRVAA